MTITEPEAPEQPTSQLEAKPRAQTVGERARSVVPEPLMALWKHKLIGPVMRAVIAAVGIPVAITVFAGSVPLGVYLNGVIVGSLYALIAIGIILVYRANRIINFAQASLGATPAVLGLLLMARKGVRYIVAVLIVVAGSLLLGAIVEIVFIRRFTA